MHYYGKVMIGIGKGSKMTLATEDLDESIRVSELIERLKNTGMITITRDGKPIARIVSHEVPDDAQVQNAVERIRARWKTNPAISEEEILEISREGRRY